MIPAAAAAVAARFSSNFPFPKTIFSSMSVVLDFDVIGRDWITNISLYKRIRRVERFSSMCFSSMMILSFAHLLFDLLS